MTDFLFKHIEGIACVPDDWAHNLSLKSSGQVSERMI
jgi:hypothetical protein